MTILLVFTLFFAAVAALPAQKALLTDQKIVGGTLTTIQQYPFSVVMMMSFTGANFAHICGGSIINNRSILTAAHCPFWPYVEIYRIRAGSSYAHSGGVIHNVKSIFNHHLFNRNTLENDISVLQVTTPFVFSASVQAGAISGPNYSVPDNSAVWAIGWGATSYNGPVSEQLRHVNIWTVNHQLCKQRYAALGLLVTDYMLCAGWLDVGGRDQCQGDSGSPLLHNNVIVGVSSWGEKCALPQFPGVNVRVSKFTSWIQSHA